MFKKILMLLCIPLMLQAQDVQHIGQLFDSLKTHPQTKGDEIAVQQAETGKQMAYSKLYPTIDGFGRYDYASNASPMLPLPPNDLFAMKADPAIGQPYSQNIYRIGVVASMPIFIKSIYTTTAMAKMLVQSAKGKAEIDLLQNEALLVSLNANLLYIESLQNSLNGKKNSLFKTKQFIEIKVNNGRASGDALLKVNNALSDVSVSLNDLDIQRQEVMAIIFTYTGITLSHPLIMEQTGNYQSGELRALNPLTDKLKASKLAYRAEKEKLLPQLLTQASYSDNFAKAYNNGLDVNNHYATVGVVLRVPILGMDQYAQIKKSRLDMLATANELDKTKMELSSQATQYQNSLLLLDNSIGLYTSSIKDKESLLEIARVSYKSDQMTMEDYLKYEDDVVLEQSKLYKSQAQKWQTLMKLAVIYGNKIEEIVK